METEEGQRNKVCEGDSETVLMLKKDKGGKFGRSVGKRQSLRVGENFREDCGKGGEEKTCVVRQEARKLRDATIPIVKI